MNYRFSELTMKALLAVCLAVTFGGLTSCSDDYDLDDKGNYPSWLGQSIYEELKNPNQEVLTGTFTNYLRLVDDLGYTETLSRTGSKTVFPANDAAFARFFANNSWGVKKYEDLTPAMKRQLLYSSMLDNAILIEMLSNVSNTATSVSSGIAMKHTTGANVIDTITHAWLSDLPVNNSYWDRYKAGGIDMVMDGTRPMMVHFTNEQLTANNITTMGSNSDFEIITGKAYSRDSAAAYIFRDRVIKSDVTCKNGYIQQLEDVLVPPGNLAELIRTNGESKLFSRMLDRFSAPYYNATITNNYNDWAVANGQTTIDSIFEKRYFSSRSQGSTLNYSPYNVNKTTADVKTLLPYDPGWNTYTSGSVGTNALSDVAAMFVPTDAAMEKYFLTGSGATLIERYGKKPNTLANLEENIDSIPAEITVAFLSNLMKSSFINSVPSKFANVMDDASDPMGITLSDLNKNTDGTYDVKIANNGVAYMLNTVFSPKKYVAVSAPAYLNQNMSIMNEAILDGESSSGHTYLFSSHANFYAYLLAMSANYALFIPTNEAFGKYYIDPVYLGHTGHERALRFYYNKNKSPYVFCSAWSYNPSTNEIGDSIGMVSSSEFRTQMMDILNNHTIVLGSGEKLGSNKFYKTKAGGEIKITGAVKTVRSGAQIDNDLPVSNVTNTYNQENGTAYAIDHIIQMPHESVYKILSNNNQFSEFMDLCNYDDKSEILSFAGLSTVPDKFGNTAQDAYTVFKRTKGLDQNVSYFNAYNYTVYAPDNTAMEEAYSKGLPRWSEIKELMESVADKETSDPEYKQASALALAKCEAINNFIRYHFQDNAIYADNTVSGGTYATACADTLGIRSKLTISGGNDKMEVRDISGRPITINGNSSDKMVNQMARDFIFNGTATTSTSLVSSSFSAIHEISSPLCLNTSKRYDDMWRTASAKRRLIGHQKMAIARAKKLLHWK